MNTIILLRLSFARLYIYIILKNNKMIKSDDNASLNALINNRYY